MANDFINILQEVRGTNQVGEEALPEEANGIYHDIVAKTTEDDNVTPRLGSGLYGSMKIMAESAAIIANNMDDVNYFADIYQGPKAVDPEVRNSGDELEAGDLYFNTADNRMMKYTGTAWEYGPHNELTNIQGGAVDDYQHITTAQVTKIDNISITQAVDLDAIELNQNEHLSDVDNPHSVTKAQVGLSEADNTSDINKPISTAVQDALDIHDTSWENLDTSTRTFTNKTLNDISNEIHADVVHYEVQATASILMGQALVATGITDDTVIKVAPRTSLTQPVIGIAETDIANGVQGEAIAIGVVSGITNTGSWVIGNVLYPDAAGGLTTSANIANGNYNQPIAYVVKANPASVTLIVNVHSGHESANLISNAPFGGVVATNVQDAINELDTDKFDKTGGVITSDVEVQGNFTVSGTTTTVNSTTVTTADNLIVVNSGEVGTGVTAGEAGIQIDRGLAPAYEFKFDESDDSFKIGEIGGLQKVATREDTPTDSGVAVWDSATSTFITSEAVIHSNHAQRLAVLNISSIVYTGSGDPETITYSGVDNKEVISYDVNGNPENIAHYLGSVVATANTVITYDVGENPISTTYTEI